MIQELFGGSNVTLISGGERSSKLSSNNNTNANPNSLSSIFEHNSPHNATSSSSTAAVSTTIAAAANPNNNTSENLRCPRCDSSNTKFCYYNNYNLTQPRHFCKTCRRYWTKGGALRNVPIGGGCRKNKSPTVSALANKPTSATGKLIKAISPEIGMLRSSLSSSPGFFTSGFNQQHVDQNPILWATSQNSHLMSLLRGNQNYNPNPNHHGVLATTTLNSQFGSELNFLSGMSNLPIHTSAASIGLLSSIRDQQHGLQSQSSQAQEHRDGLQEIYQRLRSPSSKVSCFADDSKNNNAPVVLGNAPSSSFSSSAANVIPCTTTVLEPGHATSSGEFCSFMDSKFAYY